QRPQMATDRRPALAPCLCGAQARRAGFVRAEAVISPRLADGCNRLAQAFAQLRWRAGDQRDDAIDRLAAERGAFQPGPLSIRQNLPVVGERGDRRAQLREPLRRSARGRDHWTRYGLLRVEQLEHPSVGLILDEVERRR